MTGSWKALAAIAVAAAVAGWLIARAVTETAPEPAVATDPASTPVAMAAADPEASGSPRDEPGAVATPVALDASDLPVLDEAFAAINQALLDDRRVDERVMPSDLGATSVPSSLPYRRGDEFWQPMFARHEGGRR